MSDDVIVAAILLAICVIVIGVIGAVCRLLSGYQTKGWGSRQTVFRGSVDGVRWSAPPPPSPPPSQTHQHLRLLGSDDDDDDDESRHHRPPSSSSSPAPPPPPSSSSSSSSKHRAIDAEIFSARPPDGAAKVKGGGKEEEEKEEEEEEEVNPTAQPEVELGTRSVRSMRPFDAGSLQQQEEEEEEEEGPCLLLLRLRSDPSSAPPTTPSSATHNGCHTEAGITVGDDEAVVDVTSGRNLRKALSCDSVMSDTSSADATDHVTADSANKIGQLEFGLHYNSELSDLIVNVLQAKDLEKNPITGSQDSFVKLWLTPHDDRKQQTKIQKDSVNPQYSERFRFRVAPERLDESTAQFQVYSCDRYARQKLIGETEVRLGDIDVRHPVRVWMVLHEMDQKPEDFGDIMFSLAYLPTAERLTVVIAKARNLQCPVGRLSAGCFAKVHLLQKGKKVAKKKTSVKPDHRNPIFNEAMTFMVPAASLLTVELRISVLTSSTDRTDEIGVIGHVTVGPNSSGMEFVHWTQTMTSLRKPITMWHSLRRD